MTEQTDAAEVEALVRLFVSHQRIPTYEGLGHRCVGCDHLAGETDGSNSPRVAKHIAELLLASDWLAAREAAAEARGAERALREAAEAVERAEGPTCSQSETCHAADAILLRLRARAAAAGGAE